MIVAGAAVLAVEIFRRAGGLAGAPRDGYASAAVSVPPGARALAMSGQGDVLSLLVETPDGRQQVITLDRRSGAVLGTLTLEAGR